jgi:NADH-quinone oxidoreductase subunit N
MIVYLFVIVYFFVLLIAFWRHSIMSSVVMIGDLADVRNRFFILHFTVAFLSMAGVPPFAGFFSKWLLFVSLWNSGHAFIALFVLLMTVVGSVYYIS